MRELGAPFMSTLRPDDVFAPARTPLLAHHLDHAPGVAPVSADRVHAIEANSDAELGIRTRFPNQQLRPRHAARKREGR
jgi:hypothetical protein